MAFDKCAVHCASCDSFIVKTINRKQETTDSRNPKYLTGPVESNIFKRFLLQDVDKSETDQVLKELCDLNQGRKGIPLCFTCMELITNIYDFENEIDRIRSLIASIVTQLRGRVQEALTQVRKGSEPLKKLRVLVSHCQGENFGDITKPESSGRSTGPLANNELLGQVRSTYDKIFGEAGGSVRVTEEPRSTIETEVEHNISLRDKEEEHRDLLTLTPKLEMTSISDVVLSTGRVSRKAKDVAKKFIAASLNSDNDETSLDKNDQESDTPEISSHPPSPDSWTKDQDADSVEDNDPAYVAEGSEDSDEDVQQHGCDDDSEEDEAEETVVVKAFKIDPMNPERISLMDEPDNALIDKDKHKLVIVKRKGKKFLPRKEKRRKRLPGEIPLSQVRKTDRKNRKVTRLGEDRYEFRGYQYYKLEDGKYKCDTCGNVLKTRTSALTHVKLSHLGEGRGNHLCAECGKSFHRDANYRVHLLVHRSEAKYQCETCGKAFKQPSNLLGHKRIHRQDKKYLCEYTGCGKAFSRRRALQAHINKDHLGVREHPCDVCGKQFFTSGTLVQHRKLHFLERISCPHCSSNFAQKAALRRHLRNIHHINASQPVMEQPC